MVSVIIPVYNRRDLALQAVSSVLGQSMHDLEVILVDDGSTDGLDALLSPYLADPRLRLLRLQHSGFPGAVRNRGAEQARGEWIAFLDSDDLWFSRKLQLQLDYARLNPKVRCIHTGEIWLRGDQVVSQNSQNHQREGNLFADSLKKCIIGPSTVLISRDCFHGLGGFREDIEVAEDYEFWLRLTSHMVVGYVDEPLALKRAGYGGDQLSFRYGQIEIFRIRGLHDLLLSGWLDDQPEMRSLACGELSRKCLVYAKGARKRGHEQQARYYASLAEAYSESSSCTTSARSGLPRA